MLKILGVITARGGSKGIPGKNIKPLLGKPLIAYTIEAAKASGVFDSAVGGASRLIVSTDDPTIAEVAKKYGCEVPFLRPAELATDSASHLEVMRHAVSWLKEKENYYPDYTMILQPTSPMCKPEHIREAVALMKKGVDSVFSVTKLPEEFSQYKAMMLDKKGFLRLTTGEPIYKRVARRQDVAPNYYSAGLVYLFRTDLLFDPKNPNFYGDRVVPLIVEEKYAIDINTPQDWLKAEEIMKNEK